MAGLATAAGCAGLTPAQPIQNIDRVSRSAKTFFAFLHSRGRTIAEIRELLPKARIDSVFLIDKDVTNEELGEYIQREVCDQPFEIFLRVIASTDTQRVYRYIVKGDWRSVKMGYGSLAHTELYDSIYLHTHPAGKRIIPNSIADYIHAETFKIVSTLLVGNGIPIEFESIETSGSGVDHFEVDGQKFSVERPARVRVRSKGQLRRGNRDAEQPVRELDRIFTEKVADGHERIRLQNSDGMLITFDRNRTLSDRLNEAYRSAGIHLPMGGESFASQSDATEAPPSHESRPLGF